MPNSLLTAPVTLIELDWASQRVLTHALANILEDQGIDTDVIVRQFKLSNSDLALAASLLDAHTLTIEEAAQVWQIGNKERIDAIIKEANCQ
ncbi:hypothetical protein [Vibrio penaeicida]|uniref:hypothetical protein n=1 Tax=Vibrio penaeicida TaxID=104609 RepID=UPI0011AB4600|nr:hypothetical protein [Vibrio penaeicida]